MNRVLDGASYAGFPYNPWRFRVSLTNNATVVGAAGAPTTVPWDTGPPDSTTAPHTAAIDQDSVTAFDFTNFWYTVPVAGTWVITVAIAFNVPGTKTAPILLGYSLQRGVTVLASTHQDILVAIAEPQWTVPLADTLPLNAGDQISVLASATPAGGAGNIVFNGNAAGWVTYFSGHLLSR